MKAYFRNFVNQWAEISVYTAGVVALLAILPPLTMTQKLLLASIVFLFLHFFEEFAWPGGFAYMGVKVLLGKDEPDQTKWNCNNLSSMYGNWFALTLVYVMPLCFPNLQVLTLSAMLFNFMELFMHLIAFNVRLKRWYNPGLVTAICGLTPISIYYFSCVFDAGVFAWYDYILAVVWFALVFCCCFRSPWYWWLGKKSGYKFTEQAAYGPFEHVK